MNAIAIFIVVFIAGCVVGWLLPMKVVPLIIEREFLREMKEVDYPYHAINEKNLRTFIGSNMPMIHPFLSNKLMRRIIIKIREDHSLQIQTVIKGIDADEKMVDYLAKAGLLDELNITVKEALEKRKKDAVLNIRVNSYDLEHIKQKARKIGVKYQTFISEILHKVAEA